MAISQEYIAELTRRINIAELIGEHVELKRAGRMEKGLCPFHNEKTPSFYVYPETESYYCFGCGSGGDAISFIKNLHNLDYVETVKYLAARVGMPMPNEDDSAAKLRGRMLSINREAARFFFAQLNGEEGAEARAYLRRRGLTDTTIRRFGLGYAPDSFNALLKHLKANGFTEDELVTSNVVKRGQKGRPYDMFRGRVMFPIIDLRGNVIAFGGRRMGEDGPKYLNSSDTPVFKKSRGLFALNVAKKAAGRRFILAEGYMDVISLHQAGFDTAVATLGTALTAEQAKLISDYADELVICYDSDEAGQKATARAISILKDTNLKVTVLHMEGAKDPDEFITKYGAANFEQLLDGSHNTIEYALQKQAAGHDLTEPDGRAAYVREALNILAAEASPTEQDIYAGRIAEQANVDKQAVLNQLKTVLKNRRWRQRKAREKRQKGEGAAASINIPYGAGGNRALKVAFAEQQLVAALLRNPEDYLPVASQSVRPEQLLNPDIRTAYELILQMGRQGEHIDLASLSPHLSDAATALLSKILAQNYDIGFSPDDVNMFIGRIVQGNADPRQAAEMAPEQLEDYFQKLRESKQ